MRQDFKAVAAPLLCCTLSAPGAATTHEYQVRRLIYLATTCGAQSFEVLEAKPGHERFRLTCKNTSAFPDGVDVLCTDPDDDRSCVVQTRPTSFDQLELMRPNAGGGKP